MNIKKAVIEWKGKLIPINTNQKLDIALHHMAHPTADIPEIHQWHLARGWKGFGYNFWISLEGGIWEGRGMNQGGGLLDPLNATVISIGFQGDYERVNKSMPDAQYKAGMELINYLKSTLTIGIIEGHKHWQSTLCPGKYFPLEEMKNESRIDHKVKYEVLKKALRNILEKF